MKTPREILLARHRAVEPRLDVIRRNIVAAGKSPQDASSAWTALASLWQAPWRELILPNRRIWATLAGVWVFLALINLLLGDKATSGTARLRAAPAIMADWQEQQRWMKELLADRMTPPDVDRPRDVVPRPRTERWRMGTA